MLAAVVVVIAHRLRAVLGTGVRAIAAVPLYTLPVTLRAVVVVWQRLPRDSAVTFSFQKNCAQQRQLRGRGRPTDGLQAVPDKATPPHYQINVVEQLILDTITIS